MGRQRHQLIDSGVTRRPSVEVSLSWQRPLLSNNPRSGFAVSSLLRARSPRFSMFCFAFLIDFTGPLSPAGAALGPAAAGVHSPAGLCIASPLYPVAVALPGLSAPRPSAR